MAVVNKRTRALSADAIYIGRPSRWGNPFEIGPDGDRATVIAKYRLWLWSEIHTGNLALTDLAELNGHDLKCWCAPAACHGDVLEKAARWAHNELVRSEQERRDDV